MIVVQFGGRIFQQTTAILISTDYALSSPNLFIKADFF